MSEYLGCTDHGCAFGHPGGMGTNGGCDCLSSIRDPHERTKIRAGFVQFREKIKKLENDLVLSRAGAGALGSELLIVQKDCIAANERVKELEEQLRRSATVCPKDGCMLWKGHKQEHATKDQVEEALAANSHPKRKR